MSLIEAAFVIALLAPPLVLAIAAIVMLVPRRSESHIAVGHRTRVAH